MGKTFAVIGAPIDHSLSPNINSAVFRELNLNCSYIAYRIPKDELEEGIDGLVHVSDLSWTKKIKHPSEFVKVVKLRVQKTDPPAQRIRALPPIP
mgnify:CR=1 FL=1